MHNRGDAAGSNNTFLLLLVRNLLKFHKKYQYSANSGHYKCSKRLLWKGIFDLSFTTNNKPYATGSVQQQ